MNRFWRWVFRPVIRMLGKLPEQQLARWEDEAEKLRPKRDEAQRNLDYQESQEQQLLNEGREAHRQNNMAWKKQVAGKLIRCRRELKKAKAMHAIHDRQVAILETSIHNATIQQTGSSIKLPNAAELAQESADAELIMQELTEAADLALQVEVGAGDSMAYSQGEEAILAEFEAMAQENASTEPKKTRPIEASTRYSRAGFPDIEPDPNIPWRVAPQAPQKEQG